jgi:hypothetical protein
MLVEMVWRMMRWQPEYRPLKKWAHVLCSPMPNAASRKKAVVAIARQLAVDLWRIFIGAAQAETFGLNYLAEAVCRHARRDDFKSTTNKTQIRVNP